jgi:hypothetical protein
MRTQASSLLNQLLPLRCQFAKSSRRYLLTQTVRVSPPMNGLLKVLGFCKTVTVEDQPTKCNVGTQVLDGSVFVSSAKDLRTDHQGEEQCKATRPHSQGSIPRGTFIANDLARQLLRSGDGTENSIVSEIAIFCQLNVVAVRPRTVYRRQRRPRR